MNIYQLLSLYRCLVECMYRMRHLKQNGKPKVD